MFLRHADQVVSSFQTIKISSTFNNLFIQLHKYLKILKVDIE